MSYVNHAVYLQHMETARVELARGLGMIKGHVPFQLHRSHGPFEYKKPIRNEPRVTVSCWMSRIGHRSWDLDYTVSAGRAEFAIGRTTQVGYDYHPHSTVRIYEKLRKNLEKCTGKPSDSGNSAELKQERSSFS